MLENYLNQFISNQEIIAYVSIALAIWTLPWKGWALWRAARLEKKWWFVALLVINTLGILEILYIFVFSKKQEIPKAPPANQVM